jgi:hypothetical protein
MNGDSNAEVIPPPSGEGTVVLDIGGDAGAAAIFTEAALSGSEIEIKPLGQPWKGVHTAVRRRDLPNEVCFAAVFGSNTAGQYQLRVKGTASGQSWPSM